MTECTTIWSVIVPGLCLLGQVPDVETAQHAPQEVLDKVQRWASLGREAFDERVGECAWEVALVIPYSAFFLHDITSLDGKTLRANFYKCGDKLQTPHFLSWNPIGWRSRTSIVRSSLGKSICKLRIKK